MAITILHLDVNACRVHDHLHWWPQPVPAHRTAPGSSHHVLLIGAGPPDLLPWEITSFKVWPAFLTVSKAKQALGKPELLLFHVEGKAWAQETGGGNGPV